MILYIDTAFDETILAVKKDEKIFVEKISKNINISQTLIEKTRHIFDKIGKEKQDIEVIGFNNGPGNFTSLRVALAYIKAISYYLKIPVVPLNSFQVLALSILKPDHNSNTIIAVDARMNEIYWARYKNYSEILDNQSDYNLTSESVFYQSIVDQNLKKQILIKNNSNILKDEIINSSTFNETTIYENMNDMNPIFSFIERSLSKNLVKSIDKVNLLYLRDDVAKKKNE